MIFRVITAAVLLLAAPAAAHRGHDAMTVVTIAPDGGVRVSHRFAAHDVEPALARIAPEAQANLDDPEAVKALVAYLERQFSLASERGAIALVATGTEIDADEVRVTFAGNTRQPIARLTVINTIMQGLQPGQMAQVNVRHGNTVRTLVFRGGGTQTVALGKVARRR